MAYYSKLFHGLPRIPLPRLSEKGSEQRSEGGFRRYEDAEMGPKEPAGRSVGLRHGHLQDFSDSLRREILRSLYPASCIASSFGTSKARLAPSNTKPKRHILWCRMDMHLSGWLLPSVSKSC